MTITHKEMTAHIRSLIKRDKIPARVSMFDTCGIRYIRVSVVAHDARWTADQLRRIAFLADCNNLTGARAAKINTAHEAQLTDKMQFNFEFHGGKA